MNVFKIILLIPTTLFFACSQKPEQPTISPPTIVVTTPEVLVKNNSDFNISSYSSKGRIDIISKLYNEALSKNKILEHLDKTLNVIQYDQNDQLEAYNNYLKTNLNYWSTTDNYINRISDTLLNQKTKQSYLNKKARYEKKMEAYYLTMSSISQKETALADELVMLKLTVTESMMKNYQHNERPKIETLNNLVDDYEKLIKESKALRKTYSK